MLRTGRKNLSNWIRSSGSKMECWIWKEVTFTTASLSSPPSMATQRASKLHDCELVPELPLSQRSKPLSTEQKVQPCVQPVVERESTNANTNRSHNCNSRLEGPWYAR